MFVQHLTTQFLKNVSPVMATAANYYLRAAFFSDLGKKKKRKILTLALREVSVSETGCTCLRGGGGGTANTNTSPSESVHYFTTAFQLAERIVTHAREPSPNHGAQRAPH